MHGLRFGVLSSKQDAQADHGAAVRAIEQKNQNKTQNKPTGLIARWFDGKSSKLRVIRICPQSSATDAHPKQLKSAKREKNHAGNSVDIFLSYHWS